MDSNENGSLFGSKVIQGAYNKMRCKCGWQGYKITTNEVRVPGSNGEYSKEYQCPMCHSHELTTIEVN